MGIGNDTVDGNQKSGVHLTSWGNGSWNPIIYQGFSTMPGGKTKDMVVFRDPETNSNFAPENEWFLIGISSSRGPFSGANC